MTFSLLKLARRGGRLLFVMLLLAAARPTFACSAGIGKIGTVPIADYDPFRGGAAKATLRVSIKVADPTGCALALSIAGTSPGAGRTLKLGSAHLIYRLFHRDREFADDPNAFMPLEIDHDDEILEITIDVPAGQIGPAGTYFDPLVLRLVDLNAAQAQLGPEMSAIATAAIDSRAQANIAGSASSFDARFGFATLDLGILRLGAEGSAILQLRSTAPVSVKVSSQNGGALKRVGLQAPSVGYELLFDEAPVSLSGAGATLARPASISFPGTSYHLVARVIDDPSALPAGDYRDLITIDVQPN